VYVLAALGGLLCLAVGPFAASRHPLTFDDAYVYFRYAVNIGHGLGIAWNPDGMPTYGPISLMWAFALVPFTKLPVAAGVSLQLASWLTGIGALAVMAFCIARHSRSGLLRLAPASVVIVALPLLVNPRFDYHLITGMDTMLSLLMNALLICGILQYAARPSLVRALLLGVIGFAAVAARPENFLCALGAPLIACSAGRSGRRWPDRAAFLATFVVLYGADLLFCHRYFGVAFPLAFLLNSSNSYRGFTSAENPLEYALTAILCMLPFLGLLGACARDAINRINLALLLPATVTVLGLLAMRQHMGFLGRYYVPFFPYLIVPALRSFDGAVGRDLRAAALRAGAGVLAACLIFALSLPLQRRLSQQFLVWSAAQAVTVPRLTTGADRLPATEGTATMRIVAQLIAGLPSTLVVAAPEVGLIGYASPDKTIIDLVGLNDNDIAKHGFSMDRLLDRAPDLIWFPPQDYTGLRATLFSDPRLTERYQVVAGAFNYGIALRRESPYWSAMQAALGSAWNSLYPQRRMQDYVARQVEAIGP
jgi:hypothetical protein